MTFSNLLQISVFCGVIALTGYAPSVYSKNKEVPANTTRKSDLSLLTELFVETVMNAKKEMDFNSFCGLFHTNEDLKLMASILVSLRSETEAVAKKINSTQVKLEHTNLNSTGKYSCEGEWCATVSAFFNIFYSDRKDFSPDQLQDLQNELFFNYFKSLLSANFPKQSTSYSMSSEQIQTFKTSLEKLQARIEPRIDAINTLSEELKKCSLKDS